VTVDMSARTTLRALSSSIPLVIALGLATGACSFAPDYEGTHYLCGAGDTCPSGYACAAGVCVAGEPGGPDAHEMPGAGTWRTDTASDFDVDGHVATGATIDPRGAIEPFAYYTGGVLQTASEGAMQSAAQASWTQVTGFAPTPRVTIARSADVSWGTKIPPGVGLTVADQWTLRFEGEVWLDAGDWTLFLLADDHGFLEVDGGSGVYDRVVSADYPYEASGTVHAATSGWYPVRWAVSDTGGGAAMRIRYQGPGVAQATTIPRHRLRARVDGVRGLVEYAFDGALYDGDRGITIDTDAPADVDWAGGAPADLGLSSNDNFSVRWSGQWHVDTAGAYALRYASDDGQRLWIDGAPLLDAWDNSNHDQTTAPMQLEAGWHDVVIDQSERFGSARAQLTVASGPDLVGQPLPVDHLRVVEGRGERHEHGANHNDLAIPDAPSASVDGVVESPITFALPTSVVTHGVDVGFTYDHEWQGDLRIELLAPSGKRVVLRDAFGNNGGSYAEHYARADLDGEPVGGTWIVRFIDVDPGAVGTVRDVELTVHTEGAGAPPIEPVASYVSPVRDLGAAAAIQQVRWVAHAPVGTAVAVAVRTCATADACAAAPWSDPLADPTGTTPAVAAARFAQYKVDLTSTGDATPSLESIELDYGP
jgi:subtilisin-like proprotein convertase family protein